MRYARKISKIPQKQFAKYKKSKALYGDMSSNNDALGMDNPNLTIALFLFHTCQSDHCTAPYIPDIAVLCCDHNGDEQ